MVVTRTAVGEDSDVDIVGLKLTAAELQCWLAVGWVDAPCSSVGDECVVGKVICVGDERWQDLLGGTSLGGIGV